MLDISRSIITWYWRQYKRKKPKPFFHYDDIIMGAIASQITSLTIVYSTVYSGADQRKHQSSASLAFVRGIHRVRWIPRVPGEFPAQMASNTENVPIWWRHHENMNSENTPHTLPSWASYKATFLSSFGKRCCKILRMHCTMKIIPWQKTASLVFTGTVTSFWN